MSRGLIALHYQNDVCHPDGAIPFAVDRSTTAPQTFLETSRRTIEAARRHGWIVVHVHIAFAPDYVDLPRNCRLFRAVETFGAVRAGSWGAAPFAGFEPAVGDVVVVHRCNNAFQDTGLDAILRDLGVDELAVMGLATQYSVEHTVRHAVDLGYAVTLLKDCCGSADPEAAEASFRAMRMLADVVPSAELRL
ncbi:MAG TPA: cysteine hydrolase [Methylomirabilota bacterium]|nr:cysteine hydrolase [Methylomirabilota bacterium]